MILTKSRVLSGSKRIVVTLILMALVLQLTAPGQLLASGADPWTQWRGSPDHQGVSSYTVPQESQLRWRYRTDGQVQSSPVFYEDWVIIGSDDGRVYCLDTVTGELQWRFVTGGAVQATPLVHDGRVYIGSLDGIFYCIDIPDPGNEPQEAWRYDCGGSIVSSAHVYAGSVLFGSHNRRLYRLTLTGDHVWNTSLGSDIWASPLVDQTNEKVYIGCINGDFSSINLSDGNISWTVNVGEIYSSGCLWNNVIYLCGGADETLHALDAGDGSPVWTFDSGYATYSTPSVHNDRVFFGSWEYTWCVPAEDPNTDGIIDNSEVIWSNSTNDFQGGSSALVTDTQVFIGSDDRNVYCFDYDTGSLLWNYTTNGYIYSSPVLTNGTVIVGSCDGYIYCIGDRAPGLSVDLDVYPEEITADDRSQLNITVVDQFGEPVQDAHVNVILSAGDIRGPGDGPIITTDHNGKAYLIFEPPPVSSRSTVEIMITGEKDGVTSNEMSTFIVVEPGEGDDDSTSSVLDTNEKRIPYIALLIIIIVINILLLAIILNQRRKNRERDMPVQKQEGSP